MKDVGVPQSSLLGTIGGVLARLLVSCVIGGGRGRRGSLETVRGRFSSQVSMMVSYALRRSSEEAQVMVTSEFRGQG